MISLSQGHSKSSKTPPNVDNLNLLQEDFQSYGSQDSHELIVDSQGVAKNLHVCGIRDDEVHICEDEEKHALHATSYANSDREGEFETKSVRKPAKFKLARSHRNLGGGNPNRYEASTLVFRSGAASPADSEEEGVKVFTRNMDVGGEK